MIPLDKKTARRKGLESRAAIPEETRKEKDLLIQSRVIEKIRNRNVIGCYVSMNDEADTSLIREYCYENGKILAVPKVTGKTLVFHRIESDEELKEGCFHVREPYKDRPVQPEDIDFMIVPLSSFDSSNNRTGYGKGFYDSVLERCPYKAGIAYEEQRADHIEADPWDIPLDEIITA